MAQDQKLIVVRNATVTDVDERIASYAEITSGVDGKPCKVELMEDTATGEFLITFPDDIPYYHFTLLLSALNMPWINNPGAKAAGWAIAREGEGAYMHIIAKDESDVLVAVNDKNEGIIIVGGETSPISSAEKMPVEFFAPNADSGQLKAIASYGLILEDFDVEDEDDDDELAITPEAHAEVKKMSMVTVVIIIAVVSAGLIALFLLAE
ncbi:MAG: hypothetical protein M0D57_06610 [Sphingobacteriales bacterium JAD_PAG50586_3]|nr:MAG: hypothetical protein M0D57_06610 [Sphingobacteriales bacterium JAD_PAG50586_3]